MEHGASLVRAQCQFPRVHPGWEEELGICLGECEPPIGAAAEAPHSTAVLDWGVHALG